MSSVHEAPHTFKQHSRWQGYTNGQRAEYFPLFSAHIDKLTEHGDELRGCCPFHDDHTPSWNGNRVTGLWKCHGCGAQGNAFQFADRVGEKVSNGYQQRPIVATYDYTDEAGNLLYQSVRYAPKDFLQRRPDGHGGWLWKLKDTRRVLYRLPEIVPAGTVYIVEGEKDANRLASLGLTATTNSQGAGNWREEYNHYLADKHIVILPDNDDVGEQHALKVAHSLLPVAASVKIVRLPELPPKGDVSDWLNAGHTKEELLAIIEATPAWQYESNGNGASHTFDMGEDEDDEQETEEEENARMMREERPVDDPYPCPAHLFRGPFLRVAEEMGKFTWEVWTATLVALGAKAHRNIAYKYHRMLYGMVYALLIKGTGMGKGLSTDLCRGLMPDWYMIRDAVQSGPALAPLLADITRDKKGKVEFCSSHPALLLIEEFTVLLKNAGIQHSTLIDSLNSLFHRPWPWNISRSDANKSGGGDVKIVDPTLSILATTTEALFKEYVSPQMIRSGFLNRYLVLPGDATPWKFYDPEGAGNIIQQNLGLFDYIPHRKMGEGKTVWQAYEPPALQRIKSWGEETFEPIMQSSELEAESVKRLHVYAHVIGLLYAWGEGRDLVNLEDVECSISVIETSQRFLQSLITEDREPEVPKFKAYEMNLEQRILAKVTEAAALGIRRRSVMRDLARHATSPDLAAFITNMVRVGTIYEVAEKTEGAKKPAHKLYLPEHNPERKQRQKNES